MTDCTCGHTGVCLTCQLADLELTAAADLLLLDPFVVAAAEAHHRLGRALADHFAEPLSEPGRSGPDSAPGGDADAAPALRTMPGSLSASPNVYPIRRNTA